METAGIVITQSPARTRYRQVLAAAAIVAVAAIILAPVVSYLVGNAKLRRLLTAQGDARATSVLFANGLARAELTSPVDMDYLLSRLKRATKKYVEGEPRWGYECTVEFAPFGRATCRITPYMDQDLLWVSMFMSEFAIDEDIVWVRLDEPMPPGIKDLLGKLRAPAEKGWSK